MEVADITEAATQPVGPETQEPVNDAPGDLPVYGPDPDPTPKEQRKLDPAVFTSRASSRKQRSPKRLEERRPKSRKRLELESRSRRSLGHKRGVTFDLPKEKGEKRKRSGSRDKVEKKKAKTKTKDKEQKATRKPHRYKSGTVATREVFKLRWNKHNKQFVPAAPLNRLVNQVMAERSMDILRMDHKARDMIRTALQCFAERTFVGANACAIFTRQQTLGVRHLRFFRFICAFLASPDLGVGVKPTDTWL